MASYRESLVREDEARWRATLDVYGLPQRRQPTALERTNRLLVALIGLWLVCAALLGVLVVLR